MKVINYDWVWIHFTRAMCTATELLLDKDEARCDVQLKSSGEEPCARRRSSCWTSHWQWWSKLMNFKENDWTHLLQSLCTATKLMNDYEASSSLWTHVIRAMCTQSSWNTMILMNMKQAHEVCVATELMWTTKMMNHLISLEPCALRQISFEKLMNNYEASSSLIVNSFH